jgi:YVTN family beta-propeller protein
LSSGAATCTTSSLAAGSHAITAAYGGDAVHAGSTSNQLTQVVNPVIAPTTTSINSSGNPSVHGQAVTFYATVSGNGPTGSVIFKDGNSTIIGCGGVALNAGQASCTTTLLNVGTHAVTAMYSGDSGHATSTSSSLSQSVTLRGVVRAYVSNASDNTVSVIDASSNSVLATIAMPASPGWIAPHPDGHHIYVVMATGSVAVLDTATNAISTTIAVGSGPGGIGLNGLGTRAYVPSQYDHNVAVIDTATNTVIATIPIPTGYATHVGVHPDGSRVYVGDQSSTVYVIDANANTVIASIGVGAFVGEITVSPWGEYAYAANINGNSVSVIDTATNTVVATVPAGPGCLYCGPVSVAVHPAGTYVYAPSDGDSLVHVIRASDNTAVASAPTGNFPIHAAVDPDGSSLYVSKYDDGTVSVIATATNTVTTVVGVGVHPGGSSVVDAEIASSTITGFAPSSGGIGTSVMITGTHFTGASAVRFNGTSASYVVNSSTQIVAVVPAGATSGSIGVTTPGGTATSGSAFTVVAAPTITTFTPASGPVGTSVVITGSNLTGATTVRFNGLTAIFTVNSATQITATVPTGATTGVLTVTTPGGTATSSSSFTVTAGPAPTISSFTPTSGPVGTSVTIKGTSLAGATAVTFNGIAASFTVKGMQILATVPSGATTGRVAVTTPGGTATSSTDFTVISPPTITSFTPQSGPVGTSVTITGTNFTGATTVKIGNSGAVFTVNSSTSITATVPKSAKTGPISVTTPAGTATSASNFTVTK